MPIFSKESLETLRQRIDLTDVISSFVDLKKTGATYKGLCPFHDEKSPSFMVQKGDTHYHCFGCGAHGDAIQFLMEHQKLTFTDSIEFLAQRFNVLLEVKEGKEEETGPKKGYIKEALHFACDLFHFYLLHTEEGHEALQYLYKRGLDLDFIRKFRIGLAPKTSGVTRKAMHAKRFSDEVLQAAGLITDKKREFFQERITFPICDATGAVIGFSARKYHEETFGGKYVNTPETPLFKKSRVLFGLNYSRRRIAKERQAIIVEGQIDALRLIDTGFDITVAGQGTAFGEGHIREMLQLGVHQVWLAFDPDEAGQNAAMKVGDLFQKASVEVKIVALPAGMDPDSFLRRKGPEAFSELIANSVDYLTFLVAHLSKQIDMNSPAGKNELVQQIANQIRQWDQPVMVQESLRKLATLTRIPETLIGVDTSRSPNMYIKKRANAGLHEINPDLILETDFLRWPFLMGEQQPEFVELARANIQKEQLRVPACQNLYAVYLKSYAEETPRDLLSLVMELGDESGQEVLSVLMQKRINRDRGKDQLIETMQRILDRNWMQERERIQMQIQAGDLNDDQVIELMKTFDEIKKAQPKVKV
jgi:DNA primase